MSAGPEPGVVAMVRDQPGGPAWLAALPRLVADLARDWELTLGPPWLDGMASWTAPAVDRMGRRAVLKVSWPHDEAAGEAAALRHWDGNGAVRLLRHDPDRWALLLERCEPGTALRDHRAGDDAKLTVGAALLQRLWDMSPDPPLPTELAPRLVEVSGAWAAFVEQRAAASAVRLDRPLVALAADLLRTLPADAEREVLLHGDANPGNVLRAGQRWVVIDPKPMVGDPAYDPWPLLVQVGDPFDAPDPRGRLRARYAAFGELARLPPSRLVAWSVARTVRMALWEDERGRAADAATSLRRARLLADLLG
ncbi:MAG TPA: aminoglycoside phosphotransferase family protein [Egicoccus sp.]|nr:aminoglycoside phosphotransferase family protein [Egicoccus sp.]HSK24464.1 aminoglycoside phosphotransferase family protein [Egicoccus sp.]